MYIVSKLMFYFRYLAKLVHEREGFELLLVCETNESLSILWFHLVVYMCQEPEYTSVSFWYIPPSLRNCTDQEERKEKLGKVAPFIKAKMVQEGKIMIGYQPLGNIMCNQSIYGTTLHCDRNYTQPSVVPHIL